MTKLKRIKIAREEALRFVTRCDRLIKRLDGDSYLASYLDFGVGCKESGAVNRASMDLTRALADMRKPCHD